MKFAAVCSFFRPAAFVHVVGISLGEYLHKQKKADSDNLRSALPLFDTTKNLH